MKKPILYCNTRLTESYWPADTSKPLLNSTIGDQLRAAATEFPERLALVEGIADPAKRRKWTYAQLLAEAERVADALLKRYQPGDRIAIWSPNLVEWALIQYGVALAGMTLVTVSPAYQARELEYLLGQSDSSAVFVSDEYRGHNMLATAQKVKENLPHLKEIIRFEQYEEFVKTGRPVKEYPQVGLLDTCMIMYTSGTTGFPKGAMLTHNGLMTSSAFMAERAGLELGGVWVNVMPMFHMGGAGFASLGPLARRATHVLAPAFDPLLFLNLVESEKGTYALLVPTMIEAILGSPDFKKYDLSTLKTIQSGASKVESSLVRRVISELGGCRIAIVFGQTEAAGGVTETFPDDTPEDQAETIGQPYPQCEMKIADPATGAVLPIGQVGEICARGYAPMKGYYNMPDETKKTLRDGWLHTGDMGSMDERGFLKITGRLKDMIIRGGENVYPAEVEKLLKEYPKVGDAAVVGIPDNYWGEVVAAILIPKSKDGRPSVKELDDFCRINLANYKRPRVWFFVDSFPTTEAGKLRKFMLREQIEKGELKPVKE